MLFEKILSFQNWILHASPGLLPLLALFYSAVTSLHCALMCSSFVPTPKNRSLFFAGRVLGYTLLGTVFGQLGNWLTDHLEIRLFAILAFLIFGILTLIIAGYSVFPQKLKLRLQMSAPLHKISSWYFLRGSFFSFFPCHRLAFFYSLAVLTASPLGGALVMLGHALASTPALAYGNTMLRRFSGALPYGPRVLKFLILSLVLLNLAYFGSRLFMNAEESKAKILFCL